MIQRIAAFITPHGLGHASRAIGVLAALQHRIPQLAIDICTTVPASFFTESLRNLTFHQVTGDVGLVQHDALKADLPATVRALDNLLPFPESLVDRLAAALDGCDCILADIAPLGLAVAARASIPSVLVENFTWDWIYEPLIPDCPGLARHGERVARLLALATLHIQTEPICRPVPEAIRCPPIFRPSRTGSRDLRHRLDCGTKNIVVITMGGVDLTLPAWHQLDTLDDCFFVFTGQPQEQRVSDNQLALSRSSDIYHPDLIGGCDLAVFKSGYSTMAECLQGGTRVLGVSRPFFRESTVLDHFLQKRLGGTLIDEEEFFQGAWLDSLPALLEKPRPQPAPENGADHVARHIIDLCQHKVTGSLTA